MNVETDLKKGLDKKQELEVIIFQCTLQNKTMTIIFFLDKYVQDLSGHEVVLFLPNLSNCLDIV